MRRIELPSLARRLLMVTFVMMFGGLAGSVGGAAAGQRTAAPPAAELATIRQLLLAPEASIDLLRVKLAIDRMIDPATDEKVIRAKVDDITRRVLALVQAKATDMQKLEALSAFLYDPGPWNGGQVYRYDLDGDPLGRDLSNKLLTKYLATRRGNCVSMPVLFVIVGQRLGLPVTLARAPQHLFVKYRTRDGGYLNIETTDRAQPAPDEWYIRTNEIAPAAVKNGLFLRPLTKREAAVQIVSTYVEHLTRQRDYRRLHPLLDLLMQYDARDSNLMLAKGNAYTMELSEKFARWQRPDEVPAELRGELFRLRDANLSWYSKAEALGWTQPSEELIKRLDGAALKAAQPRSNKGTQ